MGIVSLFWGAFGELLGSLDVTFPGKCRPIQWGRLTNGLIADATPPVLSTEHPIHYVMNVGSERVVKAAYFLSRCERGHF